MHRVIEPGRHRVAERANAISIADKIHAPGLTVRLERGPEALIRLVEAVEQRGIDRPGPSGGRVDDAASPAINHQADIGARQVLTDIGLPAAEDLEVRIL